MSRRRIASRFWWSGQFRFAAELDAARLGALAAFAGAGADQISLGFARPPKTVSIKRSGGLGRYIAERVETGPFGGDRRERVQRIVHGRAASPSVRRQHRARWGLARALNYPYAPKAGAPPEIHAVLAEVRPRDRMRRHGNAFRSAALRFRRSKSTRSGRKTRAAFFPAWSRIWLSRLSLLRRPHVQRRQTRKRARRYACGNFDNGTNRPPSVGPSPQNGPRRTDNPLRIGRLCHS